MGVKKKKKAWQQWNNHREMEPKAPRIQKKTKQCFVRVNPGDTAFCLLPVLSLALGTILPSDKT